MLNQYIACLAILLATKKFVHPSSHRKGVDQLLCACMLYTEPWVQCPELLKYYTCLSSQEVESEGLEVHVSSLLHSEALGCVGLHQTLSKQNKMNKETTTTTKTPEHSKAILENTKIRGVILL